MAFCAESVMTSVGVKDGSPDENNSDDDGSRSYSETSEVGYAIGSCQAKLDFVH